jgi:hypothetical protein
VRGRAEGAADRGEDATRAEAAKGRHRAQGHMDGMRSGMCRTSAMRDAAPASRRPGVGFRPAPRRRPPQVRGVGRQSCVGRRGILIGLI